MLIFYNKLNILNKIIRLSYNILIILLTLYNIHSTKTELWNKLVDLRSSLDTEVLEKYTNGIQSKIR
ncbi:MAG: hypothetical protein PG981_001386 [Wolbachia endosymbiont of Ctenocephalides orientis wCori]|nr:MAG: hypothetical protein PG981_001386 [Wolbachia endosymbiont of Ctenocephalides orientis wCori]